MDQQKPNTENHVPTAEEIARLEAEAVAALRRGEAIDRRGAEDAAAPSSVPGGEAPARPGFVPYVDDVPDPVPAPTPSPDRVKQRTKTTMTTGNTSPARWRSASRP